MKIKTIILITLLASTVPLTSHAWGKKKKELPHPENAWSILLATNGAAAAATPDTEAPEAKQPAVDPANRWQPQTKEHKTAPQQFATAHSLLANADKARVDKNFVTAIELYDKSINAYTKLKNEYPDWQPAVIKFRKNHCTYHLKELLREANEGKIKLETGRKPKQPKPTQQEKSSALIKSKKLLMQNKNEEARDLLIKTLMSDPDNKDVRLMIGIVQCRLKQYHDAIYLLETLIEEHLGDANTHVILATAYFGAGQNKDSIAQLDKALKLDSFHKEANFNMAKVLLKTTPNDTEAIAKHYIKAVELGSIRDPKLDDAILNTQ